MTRPPHVWIVESDYTGELRAREGLARRLNFQHRLIPKPNGDYAAYLRHLHELYRRERPERLIVISGTGEETTGEIADLKTALPGPVFTVFLASILPDPPDPRLWDYDLIASPQLRGENIVTLPCVPHTLTEQRLAKAKAQQALAYAPLPKPITAILIGGNTRYCFGFDRAHAQGLARRIRAFWQEHPGALIATNSRRTPQDAWAMLQTALSDLPASFLDWQTAPQDAYPALLAHADYFIVTGDSLSMCSEAVSTGKPVWIDITDNTTECYHRDISARLLEQGMIKPLTPPYSPYRYQPPDPTGEIARAILARFQEPE